MNTTLSLLGMCYPVLIERNIVMVNRYRIPIPGMPKPFKGYRIAQLTDIHLGFLVSEAFVQFRHKCPFDTPVALVLSGHTHGGQVRVPSSAPRWCRCKTSDTPAA